MSARFDNAKEVTTCDGCGGRLVIPPGVIYRGMRLHKHEADRMMREDMSTEIKSPYLGQVEAVLQEILDVGSGT